MALVSKKKRPGCEDLVKARKVALFLGTFLLCIGPFVYHDGAGWGSGLTAQGSNRGPESFPLSRTPYGAAFDGTNFWVTDIAERRVVRIAPGGQTTGTFLGRGRIYGVGFNPTDGHLYVGAERRLIRINPVTVGRTDTIPVPVPRVAGVSFAGGLWYLLEKGSGKIHVYDPRLNRAIQAFQTGRRDLRDLSLRGNGLWATDGSAGVIYRYRLSDGALTGSLRAPMQNLRGLCFREGQLWVVHRDRRALVRLPYLESQYAIVSSERRYDVVVEVELQPPKGASGNLVVLLPGSTREQQASGARALTDGWRRGFTATGGTVLYKQHQGAPAAVSVRYSYRLTARNVRYYIPDDYEGPKEILAESAAFGYGAIDQEDFNRARSFEVLTDLLRRARTADAPLSATDDPAEKNALTGGARTAARVRQFVATSIDRAVPARWKASLLVDRAGAPVGFRYSAEAYLRGTGWVPVGAPDAADPRLFAHDATSIDLFHSPGSGARGAGAAFFVEGAVGQSTEFQALPSTTRVTATLRAQ